MHSLSIRTDAHYCSCNNVCTIIRDSRTVIRMRLGKKEQRSAVYFKGTLTFHLVESRLLTLPSHLYAPSSSYLQPSLRRLSPYQLSDHGGWRLVQRAKNHNQSLAASSTHPSGLLLSCWRVVNNLN